jgi:ATP-dependent Clp protease adaptor protein ClpS
MPRENSKPGLSEAIKTKRKLQEPPLFRVIMHNDHYTTMEFVVEVLLAVFHLPEQEATLIMLDIHKKGQGQCGVFTYDIAMSKISRVHDLANENGFPLRCSCEPA